MDGPFLVLLCCWLPSAFGGKSLQGVHLRAVPLEYPEVLYLMRSENGTIVGAKGRAFHIFEWLSQSLGFTYSIIDVGVPVVILNTTNRRGGLSYLTAGEADVTLGMSVMVDGRSQLADLTYPVSVTSFSLMTPIVDSSSNVGPFWLPFQSSIWWLLTCSALAIPLLLFAFERVAGAVNGRSYLSKLSKAFEYTFMALLGQGGICSSNKLAVRLVAAVWCLSCFVLVNSYCSILISFLTTSSQKPLIKSIYELTSKPNVHVVVEENTAMELTFTRADSGVFKHVGQDLKRNPQLRCNQISDCVDRVRAGGHVYVSTASLIMYYISNDLKSTGQCSMTMSKESFMSILVSFTMAARNPSTRKLDEGIIRLWETGLLVEWRKWYMKVPDKCLNVMKTKGRDRPWNMSDLSTAFVLLFIGHSLALVAFVGELSWRRFIRP